MDEGIRLTTENAEKVIVLSDRETAIGQEPQPYGRGCFDNQPAGGMVVLICQSFIPLYSAGLPANQKVIPLRDLCASSAAGGETFMSNDGNYLMLAAVNEHMQYP